MSLGTVLQLGYGMQGKASLIDILKNGSIEKVIVADTSDEVTNLPQKLNDPRIVPVKLDIRDENALLSLMKQADVVIELLPGEFTLYIARLAVKAGISLVTAMYLFNPGEQDTTKRDAQLKEIAMLHEEATSKGIVILEEFGMDPGIDLILGWKAIHELDEVKVFHSYGAGFPELSASHNPLHYKFTWSIVGVMRSYLRPARIIRDGKFVDIAADAMFDAENTHHLKLPEFDSELECFANGNSEFFAKAFGLEGSISSMGRYICRWPGTGAFWSVMAKCGFMSPAPVKVGDVAVLPEAFCAALLGSQKQFYYEHDERDVALIRSDVRGYKNGKPVRVVYQVIDYKDIESGFTSMQRTVGYPMSIGAQMILDGTIAPKGVVNPIEVPFEPFMEELAKRGITYTSLTEEWNGDKLP